VRRRTRLALLSGSFAFLVVSHYGWFRVFGPPSRWGTDVIVKVPVMSERPPMDLACYHQAETLDRKWVASKSALALPHDSIAGTPFGEDSSPQCDLDVIQTHTGPEWGDGQHLFVRNASRPVWTEIPSASLITGAEATVICPTRSPSILLVRWNSWWPYAESYPRFLRSILDRALRSEFGIYRLDVERQSLRFLFPGYGIVHSPDRRYVAYLTSVNGYSGFHNILVYKVDADRSVRVLSLWEADPGSGRSFSYSWSGDSKALLITGQVRGWASLADNLSDLHLVFLPEPEQLFDIEAQKASNSVNAVR
jgi:hypothetical protein